MNIKGAVRPSHQNSPVPLTCSTALIATGSNRWHFFGVLCR